MRSRIVSLLVGVALTLTLSGCGGGATTTKLKPASVEKNTATTAEVIVTTERPTTAESTTVVTVPATSPTTAYRPATTRATAPAAAPASSCSNGSYVNSSGQTVCSPDSNGNGATAQCRDGTYSHSQHRSGTCSGHGGVDHWM